MEAAPQVTHANMVIDLEKGLTFPADDKREALFVPVTFEKPELKKSWQMIFDSPVFQSWCVPLRPAPECSTQISAISLKDAQITNSVVQQITLTSSATHRETAKEQEEGPFTIYEPEAGVMVMLRKESNTRDRCIFVSSVRMDRGQMEYLEIPSGRMDENGHLTGPMAELVESKCGVKLSRSAMVSLTGVMTGSEVSAVSHQAGAPMRIYLFRRTVSEAEMTALELALSEQPPATLQLKMVPLGSAWNCTQDVKSMAALFLVHELRHHMLMPRYRKPRDLEGKDGGEEKINKMDAVFSKISDLDPASVGVNMRLKIVQPVTITKTNRTRRDGRKNKAGTLVVGDEFGIITMNISEQAALALQKLVVGDKLSVRNGQIDMSDRHMKLTVNGFGKISHVTETTDYEFQVEEKNDLSATEYELVECPNSKEMSNLRRRAPRRGIRGRGPRNDARAHQTYY